METALLIWEETRKNENGFPEMEKKSVEVYVEKKSVTRAEEYEAMRIGIRVDMILKVRKCDWDLTEHTGPSGRPEYARKVIYGGFEYNIIRCYCKGKACVEITCG